MIKHHLIRNFCTINFNNAPSPSSNMIIMELFEDKQEHTLVSKLFNRPKITFFANNIDQEYTFSIRIDHATNIEAINYLLENGLITTDLPDSQTIKENVNYSKICNVKLTAKALLESL